MSAEVIQLDELTTMRVDARAGCVLVRVADDEEIEEIALSVDEATRLIALLEVGIGAAYAQRRAQMTEGT